jgi:hypothetical protein
MTSTVVERLAPVFKRNRTSVAVELHKAYAVLRCQSSKLLVQILYALRALRSARQAHRSGTGTGHPTTIFAVATHGSRGRGLKKYPRMTSPSEQSDWPEFASNLRNR